MGWDDYEEKKEREKQWHLQQTPQKPSLIQRFLRSPLVLNPERVKYSYDYAKNRMRESICSHHGSKFKRMLIAPCGSGEDFEYVRDLADEIHGIDLSDRAVSNCPKSMITQSGDILKSGYPDEHFDLIVSPLFFHHLLTLGFERFLAEFYRILEPGGMCLILEPSIYYPLNIITRPVKYIFKNPMGEVEDEGPFRPGILDDAMKSAGFIDRNIEAATFSHPAIFLPVARLMNFFGRHFATTSPFKYSGWLLIFTAKKPKNETQ